MEQRFALIGINPSPEWKRACEEFLQRQNRISNEDEILNQILYADLRDVVRRFGSPNSIQGGPGSNRITSGSSPSKILRKAIILSNKVNHGGGGSQNQSYKSILPQSFKCMVQIEELLDVSQNAEQRLAHGPASSSSPTPIGNQKKRCLKLYLSDGFKEEDGNSPYIHIVAMETEPIPSLSVHSKPGIKVILAGPIVVRFGILMLDQGNTTVLGGCVPSLIPVQKKAMDLAAKLAGVGIDPTFRALVWNPETGMEDDEDEGESESRDVHVRQNPTSSLGNNNAERNRSITTGMERNTVVPVPSSRNNAERTRSIPNSGIHTITSSATPSSRTTIERPRSIPNIEPNAIIASTSSKSTTSTSSKSTTPSTQFSTASGNSIATVNPYLRKTPSQNEKRTRISSQHQQPQSQQTPQSNASTTPGNIENPYKRQNVQSATRNKLTLKKSSSANSSTPSSFHNPYAKNNPATSDEKRSGRASLSAHNEVTDSRPQQNKLSITPTEKVEIVNPYSRNPSPSANQPSHKETSNMKLTPSNDTGQSPTNINTHINTNTNTNANTKEINTTPEPTVREISMSTNEIHNLSPTALSEPLSFSELRALLVNITADPKEYSRFERKTFIVPCKFSKGFCQFKSFTIEKNKFYKKKATGSRGEKVIQIISICKSSQYMHSGFDTLPIPFSNLSPITARLCHELSNDGL